MVVMMIGVLPITVQIVHVFNATKNIAFQTSCHANGNVSILSKLVTLVACINNIHDWVNRPQYNAK